MNVIFSFFDIVFKPYNINGIEVDTQNCEQKNKNKFKLSFTFLFLFVLRDMENSLKISIPTPCHEDLGQMDKTEKGRFCLSCQKEVVDFTKMSDEDIVLYFENKKNGGARVCGTFRADQVVETKNKIEIPVQTYFYAKSNHQKFLWMLLACMGMFFVSCNSKTKGEVEISVVDSSKNGQNSDTMNEIQLTGDTIYSVEPTEKPIKIERVEKIQGEVAEKVSGFVAPIVKGGCVIPENTEDEPVITIKGKVAYPRDDSARNQQLNVPQKDTAANIKSRRDDKSIIIKRPKLFKD